MIKDRNTLEYIFTLSKQVKKPLIKIYPNGVIIGADEQFASLNILIPEVSNYNIDIPHIFRSTELASFMRDVAALPDNAGLLFSQYEISIALNGITLHNHLELSYKFDDLYSKVIDLQCYPIIYTNSEFAKDNAEMLFMKSSDCSKMFNVDEKYLMTSFNAIHPANKTDKVELILRDYDHYSYTAEFIIHKKKDKYQLHEFFRFRKL